MSGKVINVMSRHLKIAEKYIEDLNNANTREDFIKAMKSCAEKVKKQYPELKEISEEFRTLMVLGTADKELKEISAAAGECFGAKMSGLLPKMAVYMADEDFRKVQAELDLVLGNNPLFGEDIPDDSALMQVSESFATSMNAMAEKLHLETSEADVSAVGKIAELLTEFDALALRFAEAVKKAGTAKKMAASMELFVDAVKKLVPEMNIVADQMRILSAQNLLPDTVTAASKNLRKTLGRDLPEILRDKRELMADPKVKKAVDKLGGVLETLPF